MKRHADGELGHAGVGPFNARSVRSESARHLSGVVAHPKNRPYSSL